MPVTKTWDVKRMDCLASSQGKTDVVVVVHWGLDATDGVGNYSTIGATEIAPYVSGNVFTEFAALTKAQVLAWVYLAMGSAKSALESAIDADLGVRPAPMVSKTNPW